MNILQELKLRGSIFDVTDDNLEKVLENEKITFYIGADPTADSLHIGHLSVYIVAKRLQNEGHNPVLLIGGGTGFIGDPKPGNEREFLSKETLAFNAKALEKQAQILMPNCTIVNNNDWLKNINLIEYLRDFGKLFNVNYMINKDTVKQRLDSGISYTEFSYQILQSIDFHHLYKENNVTLQMGGQDQWGNITAGLELIRKKEGHEAKAYGFTIPLITKSDGTKFGKSEGGSVWLDPLKTSPYEFYQYFINIDDADVINRLKQYTFLSLDEIKEIEEQFKKEPHLRLAQKTLAKEITKYVHKQEGLDEALLITEALFKGNIKALSAKQIKIALKGIKTIDIEEGINIVDLVVDLSLASSKREARDFIKNNAISINGDKYKDIEISINKEIAIEDKYIVVRRGKKKYALAQIK